MWRPLLHSAGLAAIAICLLPSSATLAAGDANTAECSGTTEASAGFRTYLPDCRAYEMVTPPYKEGGITGNAVISLDGSRVASISSGAFAGAENDQLQDVYYEFQREGSGWETTPLSPPASLFPSADPAAAALTASADLGASVWSATTSPAVGAEENLYLEPSPGAALVLVGPEQPPPSTGGGFHHNLHVVGASQDLTHMLLNITPPHLTEIETGQNRPWPGETTIPSTPSLYEYVGTRNTEPVLVGVSNREELNGKPHINEGAALISQCGTTLGGVQESGHMDVYNAVSASGGTVFFTAHRGPCEESGVEGTGPKVSELYARLDGSATVAVSEPSLSVPGRLCTGVCEEDENEENGHERKGGDFAGASEDGSKVFFTTEQPLVNEDEGTNTDLYMEEIEGPAVKRLVQVSHDPHAGQAAEAQGVARVSQDGSHVYFVARGELTEGPNHEGEEPVAGAENLYVYDTVSNTTKFVATLLTGAEEAMLEAEERAEEGKVEEQALLKALKVCTAHEELSELFANFPCYSRIAGELRGTFGPGGTLEADRSVWQTTDVRSVQATPDGQFLVFLSSGHLTGSEDTSTAAQLFVYNAQAETLVRVSIGHNGYDEDGNVALSANAPRIPRPNYSETDLPTTSGSSLALSTDGSRVFFESGDSLAPQAVAGATNVYEYREGNAYLISNGQDTARADHNEPATKLLGTDASGRDVFFTTEDQLVPEDTDTQVNVYDARENGGFPAPESAAGCSGDACQGPLGVLPSLPSLGGSATQAGGENATPPVSKPAVKPKAKPLTRAQELTRALRACKAKRKKQRASCESQAKKRYSAKFHAKKSDGRGD